MCTLYGEIRNFEVRLFGVINFKRVLLFEAFNFVQKVYLIQEEKNYKFYLFYL